MAVATLVLLGIAPLSLAGADASTLNSSDRVAGFGVPSTGSDILSTDGPRMVRAGANSVLLDAVWQIERQDANRVFRSRLTVSDEDLLTAARDARAAGISVMLNAKVVCEGCPGDSARWRGLLRPTKPEAFYASYRAMSNHYAELAQKMGAVLYFPASEMNSLQGDTEQWRRVILESRMRFQGKIGYQVNWDVLPQVRFWDDVDVAGVSAYFPLSDLPHPTLAQLLASWQSSTTADWAGRSWLTELRAFAASHDKPVLFGEVGYQSAAQAAQHPYLQEKATPQDQQLQADAYQAVLTTFSGESWWIGALWWAWQPTGLGPRDLDYSPRGKLAEQLLQRWYTGRRPASPERSLAGPTADAALAEVAPQVDPGRASSALDAVRRQTVADTLARATLRRELREASLVAGGLLLIVLVGHTGVVVARRRLRSSATR